MNYPKTIKLEDKKLKKLLTEKATLIIAGRNKSEEIEKMEKEMEEIEKEIIEEEKKVDISDILEAEKEETKLVEGSIERMKTLKAEIFGRMKMQVPGELHQKYEALLKAKEQTETERNKLAIKAQKYTEKIVPLGRKLMQPFLEDRYEDYDSLSLEDGEIIAKVFSHLQDFETNFIKKQLR